ncbi:MAG: S41 family peptidase, partial [Endomicrobiia bacterium]
MKKFLWAILTIVFFNFSIDLFAKTEQDNTYQQLKILMDVLNYTKENYVEDVEMEKLIISAAKGIAKSLDAFSQFMEPETFKELKVETEGQFGGLGIRIAIRDEWLTVVTPLPGTPAYKIGILPGDKIIKIEGESTQGITIEDAVKKLRGTPGTKVNITIMREGNKEPIDYTIVRDIIKIEAVKYKPTLKNGIGYLAIYEFNNNSLEETVKALNDLKKQGMKGLILDLRNNPGGLLNQAVNIAKLFIGGNKLIVYTEGRRSPRQEYRADEKASFVDIPMVTLVNGGSASGAE